MIVTKWHVIKERRDFSDGYSCFYLDRGYRISKFLKSNGDLLFWYFDIVDYDMDSANNTLHIIDLLADVVVYPNGKLRVIISKVKTGAIGEPEHAGEDVGSADIAPDEEADSEE